MNHIYNSIEGWFSFPKLYKKMVESYNDAHFVEIGAWMGKSTSYMAVEIINSNKNIKFDCIDTWAGSSEHKDFKLVKDDVLFEKFLENLKPVIHSVNPIRKPSLEAVNLYSDNSLDFVFIDASHEFNDVYADIKAWYPKVKSGGVLAGHDYHPTDWPGVKRAVETFISEIGVSLDINDEDCWGILKRG